MKKKKHPTRGDVSDQVAADVLCSGGKSGPMPPHPSMQQTEENPDANATDASQDTYGDDEGN